MTRTLPLRTYLTRLIWLCMLPLVLLAAYLAGNHVLTQQAERDATAGNLAQNFAAAIDQNLNARIDALGMLAMSPLIDDPGRWRDLYQEAIGFQRNFDSHVVFADRDMHMLFNTRVPFGTALPDLPRPEGHAAAPAALATGKAAVGDIFIGPIAKEPLVAVAVPVQRQGRTAFLLIAVFEGRQFQQRLDEVALPSGWSLSLLDGRGEVIARQASTGFRPTVDGAGRFVVGSRRSPWSVVLEIPHHVYRAPLILAATAMVLAILVASLIGFFGGRRASHRLANAVAALTSQPASGAALPDIREIAEIKLLLGQEAARRAAAESAR
ncbi:MAG: cache domain-containing protein, partial [Hydrogenophilaceae bacterium]